jgi:chlorite dismutase
MQVVHISFIGGSIGDWRITAAQTLRGASLPTAAFLTRKEGFEQPTAPPAWHLRGFTSNLRYTTASEAAELAGRQAPLGRSDSRLAALIPIRKSEAWWALGQDERRAIYEERSRHTSIGMEYLPRIARKLHHSRDLGEPFDFLTWFEFGEADAGAFDELVGRLRSTEEWQYVDREVDLRLARVV